MTSAKQYFLKKSGLVSLNKYSDFRRFQKISDVSKDDLRGITKEYSWRQKSFPMNLKIKITLENKRLLRLRRCVRTRIWCAECNAEADFAAEEEISNLLEKLEKEINPHKIITSDGKSLICLESLIK